MMLQVPLSGIKQIEQQAKALRGCISLSQGALRVGGIPLQIKAFVQEMLQRDVTDYYGDAWGLFETRQEIVRSLSAWWGEDFQLDAVLMTHGCIGGLSLLFVALLHPGDEVIIPEPSYPAYTTLTLTSKARPVFVSMMYDDGCFLDLERLKAAVTEKTKIIIFSNPSNPLGIIVPEATIRELADWCAQRGIYLVVDQAYAAYTFGEKSYFSAANLTRTNDHLIVAQSFSKDFGMSGWRVGYLIGNPLLMGSLARIQDALLNSLNNTAQYAALYAMQHPELQQPFQQIVQDHAHIAYERLQPLVERNIIAVDRPDGGFFLFIKMVGEADATPLCLDLLTKMHVALVPGASFGPSGKSYLRLCFARDRDVLEEGLARFSRYLIERVG